MSNEREWWHLQDRPQARARLRRRAFPIAAYIGPNGSGKSQTAVYDCMPSLDFGRPVLSTVRLLDWRNPGPCPGGAYCDDPDSHLVLAYRWELVEQDEPGIPPVLTGTLYETGEVHAKAHPYYVPWTTYQQLLNWRDGDVLADEITGFASSREIKNMPPQVANYLVQLRRRNVTLRWTTPSWGRADKIIREVSQAVTLCVGQWPKRRRPVAGQAPRVWRDNRVFVARTYDPQQFDEVEARRLEHAQAEVWAIYVGPKALVRSAYDTMDAVQALGWANEAGVCIQCGGERRRSACHCHKDEDNGRGRGAPARKRSGAGSDPDQTPTPAPTPAPQPTRTPVMVEGKLAAVLQDAQAAAGEAGELSLVDAVTLSAAAWSGGDSE